MKTWVAVLLLSVSGCVHVQSGAIVSYASADGWCTSNSGGTLEGYRSCMHQIQVQNQITQHGYESSGPSAGQVAGSILQGMGQGIQQAQARQSNCYTQYAGNQAFTHCQ